MKAGSSPPFDQCSFSLQDIPDLQQRPGNRFFSLIAVQLIYSGIFPDGIKNEPFKTAGLVPFRKGKVDNLVSQTCTTL
jgi:hypothetical protein